MPLLPRSRRLRITLLTLAGLLVAGATYNGIQSVIEARRYPPPGQLVDIGGRRLHVYCEGESRGHPTVVLDAGAGAWSSMMARLQHQLSDSLRVCAYDRAGLGWSDPSDQGADVGTAVEDLKALLSSSALTRPVILVGHSLGANIAQVYASTYPGDLAGAVLLDPGRHDDMASGYGKGDSAAARIASCGWKCVVVSGAARLGLLRIAARRAGRKNFDANEQRVYRAGLVRPHHAPTVVATLAFLPKSALQTRAARAFGDVPLTILYSENTRPPSGDETPDSVAIWHAATLDSMRAIVRGSTAGRGPVVIPGVDHTSMVLAPHARAMIVEEVMRIARATAVP